MKRVQQLHHVLGELEGDHLVAEVSFFNGNIRGRLVDDHGLLLQRLGVRQLVGAREGAVAARKQEQEVHVGVVQEAGDRALGVFIKCLKKSNSK